MIAILCPTRGRPEQFKRMLDSCIDKSSIINPTTGAKDVWIYTSISETEWSDYAAQLGVESGFMFLYRDTVVINVVMPALLPTAHKWNILAQKAMQSKNPPYKLFMLGSDDMYFETQGWDRALIEHYNSLENKIHVYALQDSRDHDGTPHPIVTREYIDAMGYFVPPVFLHWFVDSWTVEIAKANNCFTHFKDFTLVHDKPSDDGKPDSTHTGIRSYGWRERDAYVAETCKHFLEIEKQRLAAAIG